MDEVKQVGTQTVYHGNSPGGKGPGKEHTTSLGDAVPCSRTAAGGIR